MKLVANLFHNARRYVMWSTSSLAAIFRLSHGLSLHPIDHVISKVKSTSTIITWHPVCLEVPVPSLNIHIARATANIASAATFLFNQDWCVHCISLYTSCRFLQSKVHPASWLYEHSKLSSCKFESVWVDVQYNPRPSAMHRAPCMRPSSGILHWRSCLAEFQVCRAACLEMSWELVLLNVAQKLVEFTVPLWYSWMSPRVKDSLNSRPFRKLSDLSERLHGDFTGCCLLDLCLATCRCLHTEEWPRAQLRAKEMFRAASRQNVLPIVYIKLTCMTLPRMIGKFANFCFWGCNHSAYRKAKYHPASLGLLKSISPPTDASLFRSIQRLKVLDVKEDFPNALPYEQSLGVDSGMSRCFYLHPCLLWVSLFEAVSQWTLVYVAHLAEFFRFHTFVHTPSGIIVPVNSCQDASVSLRSCSLLRWWDSPARSLQNRSSQLYTTVLLENHGKPT